MTMSADKGKQGPPEFKAQGTLATNGVKVIEKSSIDALSQRGYGTAEKGILTLAFYEALFLINKQILGVTDKKKAVDFQMLLGAFEEKDENAWTRYVVYRDLRSRGYVVREGFGKAIGFRVYERGAYGKDTASFLVLSIQEGKPLPMQELGNSLSETQSLKKELILAVINRRGEIVYYSVSPLTFK
jgi:tRNA-intron endonuclease, archaea type